MITRKQKCIAEQAIYGDLKAIVSNHFDSDLIYSIGPLGEVTLKYTNDDYPVASIHVVKPILRPLSDLLKEITHKGRNNNEPFIPLEFIEREIYKKIGGLYGSSCELVSHYGDLDPNWNMYEIYNACGSEAIPIVIDLLNGLHFDVRDLIASNKAIDINTLTVDPYKI